MSDRLDVVFTGGGTGGHLYPAIAIAQALPDRAEIAFIGTADRLETKIVPSAGYALATVHSRALSRKLSFGFVATAFVNTLGVFEAMGELARRKPDIVIATGGYVCFPVVVGARILRAFGRLRAPIALLEPNAHPGLTNRLLVPLVDEVWGAFDNADARFAGKYVHTGIPVRARLRALPSREIAVERLGLSPARRTLLAMGGSQGARSINDALVALLRSDGLPDGWQLLQLTGEKEYDRPSTSALRAFAQDDKMRRYVIRPYLDDMGDAYAAADLVLARAGASTLGELAATGRPAILVPYPHAAEDHQTANAAAFAQNGAAVVVEDGEVVAGKLGPILAEVTRPERLGAMQRAAERSLADDPLATILARVDALITRKKRA